MEMNHDVKKPISYSKQYLAFNSEVQTGFQNILLLYTIHKFASENIQPILTAPAFWKINRYNLITISIITLGRIFDQNTPYSIHKLIQAVSDGLDEFKFEEIRKRKGSKYTDAMYNELLSSGEELSLKIYRGLKKDKQTYRQKYEKLYDFYRDKLIAHREIIDFTETDYDGEIDIDSILELYISLYNLAKELSQRYYNGRAAEKLDLKTVKAQIDNIQNFNHYSSCEYLQIVKDFIGIYNSLKE